LRVFLLLILAINLVFSSELFRTIETNSNVTSMDIHEGHLYISTDGGEIQVVNLENFENEKFISLPDTTCYFGVQKAKVFNTDELNSKILILANGDLGKKMLHVYKDGNLESIELKNESIKKAKFLDEKTIVLASLSNEIYFYSLDEKKITSSYKFSTSALSDFEILGDNIIVSCEGGLVFIYSIKENKITKTISVHKDNIYDIAVANDGTIISGSTDRKAGIYKDDKLNLVEAKFLVYAVGIDESGKRAAFMADEQSKVIVIDTASLNKVAEIETNQGIINGIIFYSDLIMTSAYEKNIKIWRVK